MGLLQTCRATVTHRPFQRALASDSVPATNGGIAMSLSGIFARIVALIGAAAVLWRRLQGVPHEPAWGSAPVVPAAKPQGSIPTLQMPTGKGGTDGQTPVVGSGLQVHAVSTRLKPPRLIPVLPTCHLPP